MSYSLTVYPDGCSSFYDPLGMDCRANIWEEQGCILDSADSPRNDDSSIVSGLTIKYDHLQN